MEVDGLLGGLAKSPLKIPNGKVSLVNLQKKKKRQRQTGFGVCFGKPPKNSFETFWE